jgi:hypothetical protein
MVRHQIEVNAKDSLYYINLNDTPIRVDRFKLKTGSFKSIVEGFSGIDLLGLKDKYLSKESDFGTTTMEIRLSNGKIIKSELQSDEYPEDLRLALIPVRFGYQRFIYGGVKPIE